MMATLGSTAGGTLTYHFARKRGKTTLIRRLGEAKTQRLCRLFSRWGFWAVAVPAMLPPPFPIVPFLLTAGSTHYPKGRFCTALACGRVVKFTIWAFLASLYGRQAIVNAAGRYRVLFAILAIAVLIGCGSIATWWSRSAEQVKPPTAPDEAGMPQPELFPPS
jgi:membrane protein DedA with SNARE-associated domain